ncbi:MAG: FtsL-like putative cell division protein [Ferruginibacter sp.]
MPAKKINKEPKVVKAEWKQVFNYNRIVRNIPFFLFLALLAVLYIYNGHHADKLVRKIAVTEKNIKELQYEYKTVKSDLIFRSKASELIKAVEPLGLKEPKLPPMLLGDTIVKKVIDTANNNK